MSKRKKQLPAFYPVFEQVSILLFPRKRAFSLSDSPLSHCNFQYATCSPQNSSIQMQISTKKSYRGSGKQKRMLSLHVSVFCPVKRVCRQQANEASKTKHDRDFFGPEYAALWEDRLCTLGPEIFEPSLILAPNAFLTKAP